MTALNPSPVLAGLNSHSIRKTHLSSTHWWRNIAYWHLSPFWCPRWLVCLDVCWTSAGRDCGNKVMLIGPCWAVCSSPFSTVRSEVRLSQALVDRTKELKEQEGTLVNKPGSYSLTACSANRGPLCSVTENQSLAWFMMMVVSWNFTLNLQKVIVVLLIRIPVR